MTDDNDSIRFKRLQQISARSLEESVKYLTVDRLASCYPTIAATPKGNEALKQARSQIANYWHSTAKKEFDAIFEERDIHQKMLELDELIELARRRQDSGEDKVNGADKPVTLDKLTPEQVVDAHLASTQQQEVDNLTSQLAQVKGENAQLLKELEESGAKIDELAQSINGSLDEATSAVDAASELPSRLQIGQLVQRIGL